MPVAPTVHVLKRHLEWSAQPTFSPIIIELYGLCDFLWVSETMCRVIACGSNRIPSQHQKQAFFVPLKTTLACTSWYTAKKLSGHAPVLLITSRLASNARTVLASVGDASISRMELLQAEPQRANDVHFGLATKDVASLPSVIHRV
ncbi:hypothetical protein MKEN_01407300 [Mycena kentingensis (nom. inval.)]|nr:hypothetical protein MKEN_01407300 [Mycena kentingensis (nom. inval.)]